MSFSEEGTRVVTSLGIDFIINFQYNWTIQQIYQDAISTTKGILEAANLDDDEMLNLALRLESSQ